MGGPKIALETELRMLVDFVFFCDDGVEDIIGVGDRAKEGCFRTLSLALTLLAVVLVVLVVYVD
jgi:hypothetical protein